VREVRGRVAFAAHVASLAAALTTASARAVVAADAEQATPVGQCPRAEAVRAALQPVVSGEDAPAAPAPAPAIEVVDVGDAFRVTVNGRQREYRDESRDCARRARMAAVFAAIALELPLPQEPAPREAALRSPASTPAAPPWTATTQVEIGPAFESSVGASDDVALVGASARVAVGAGRVKGGGGVAVLAPGGDATIGALTVSHTHVPIDVGVRVVALATRWELSADAGVSGGWLRMRASGVDGAGSATVLEWGARAGAVLRYRAWQRLAPFIGAAAQVVAFPSDLYVLPRGVIGQAPRVWLSASAGANMGF